MRRKYALLSVFFTAISALLLYFSMSLERNASIAAASVSALVIIGIASAFAVLSGRRRFVILALLISILSVFTAAGIIVMGFAPSASDAVQEEAAEEETPSLPVPSEEAAEEETVRIPSAPALSVRSQELTEDEPIVSRRELSSPTLFNLIYLE